MAQASGQVFLRVLRDALLGPRGGSNLLLPRIDLGALFPEAAARWLEARGARVLTGQRIDALRWQPPHWHAAGQAFDCVIIATSAPNAAKTLIQSALDAPDSAAASAPTSKPPSPARPCASSGCAWSPCSPSPKSAPPSPAPRPSPAPPSPSLPACAPVATTSMALTPPRSKAPSAVAGKPPRTCTPLG